MNLARAGALVRSVDRLNRADIWTVVLAIIATLTIAFEMRVKTVSGWRAQTNGSSSPLKFHQGLLTRSATGGRWTLLVLDTKLPGSCHQAWAGRENLARVPVLAVISLQDERPFLCFRGGTAQTVNADLGAEWAHVRSQMRISGARLVLVESSGRVVFSSEKRTVPDDIARLLQVPAK